MHPAPQVQYPLTLQEPSCCIVRTLSIFTNVVAIPDISLSRRVDFVIGVSGRSMEDTNFDGDKVLVEKTQDSTLIPSRMTERMMISWPEFIPEIISAAYTGRPLNKIT